MHSFLYWKSKVVVAITTLLHFSCRLQRKHSQNLCCDEISTDRNSFSLLCLLILCCKEVCFYSKASHVSHSSVFRAGDCTTYLFKSFKKESVKNDEYTERLVSLLLTWQIGLNIHVKKQTERERTLNKNSLGLAGGPYMFWLPVLFCANFPQVKHQRGSILIDSSLQ